MNKFPWWNLEKSGETEGWLVLSWAFFIWFGGFCWDFWLVVLSSVCLGYFSEEKIFQLPSPISVHQVDYSFSNVLKWQLIRQVLFLRSKSAWTLEEIPSQHSQNIIITRVTFQSSTVKQSWHEFDSHGLSFRHSLQKQNPLGTLVLCLLSLQMALGTKAAHPPFRARI